MASFLAGYLERALGFHRGVGCSHRPSGLLPGLQCQEQHPVLRAAPAPPLLLSIIKQSLSVTSIQDMTSHLRYHTWPSVQAQRGGQHPLVHPDSAVLSRNGAKTPTQVFASLFAITGSFLGPQLSLPCPVPPVPRAHLSLVACACCLLAEDCLVLFCSLPALWPAGCESPHGPPREGPSDCLPWEGSFLASPKSSRQQHADTALSGLCSGSCVWSPRHKPHTEVLSMFFLCRIECPYLTDAVEADTPWQLFRGCLSSHALHPVPSMSPPSVLFLHGVGGDM